MLQPGFEHEFTNKFFSQGHHGGPKEALIEYDPTEVEAWKINETLSAIGYFVRDPKKIKTFGEENAKFEKWNLVIWYHKQFVGLIQDDPRPNSFLFLSVWGLRIKILVPHPLYLLTSAHFLFNVTSH